MLVDLAQAIGCEIVSRVEIGHGGRTIMGSRIVGCAGKSRRAWSILNTAGRATPFHIRKLTEPAGEYRPQTAARRQTKEGVAFSKLTVLIAAARHEGLFESE